MEKDPSRNNPPYSPENSAETIKSPEQRQVEDLEVLFSFCDEANILDILKSDSYGVLLDNNVSLVDLFNANALFNEQYYDDGSTKDYYWRYANLGRPNIYAKQEEYYEERNRRIGEKSILIYQGKYDESSKIIGDNPEDDVVRAREAKGTINEIANIYFSDNSSSEKAEILKDIIQVRASGEDLSEDQKSFLADEHNLVADRLLFDGHVINEERAANILSGLDGAVNWFDGAIIEEDNEDRENTKGELICDMAYAKIAIDDFIKAGKPDLVYKAQEKLASIVDKYFDVLVSTNMSDINGEFHRFKTIDNLVFGYSNPFLLVERAKKFGLCEKEYDDSYYSSGSYAIDNPNRIVEYIAHGDRSKFGEHDKSFYTSVYISEIAEDLRELGVSDQTILEYCGYPPSYVEQLEKNGFDIDEIAENFDSRQISENLRELIERGADAKKLMKHMADYDEDADYWHARGIDFVAENLGILADNGVTEEDIIKEIGGGDVAPLGTFIPRMIECRKFKTQKILDLGLSKYVDFLKDLKKAGYVDEQYVKMASSPSYYYSKIVEQLKSKEA